MRTIRFAGVFLLLASWFACDRADDAAPSGSDHGAKSYAAHDGGKRMREILANVAREAVVNNPYYGEAAVGRLEADLAAAGNSAIKRWRALQLLGWHLLRLGRNEEAVARLEEARSIVPQIVTYLASGKEKNFRSDQYGTPILGKETSFDLGVAYMRLAEQTNCCNQHTPESCILPLEGGGRHTNQEPAKKAMACFQDVLTSYPDHLASLWLLNVAAMAIGKWPDGIPERYRMRDDAITSDEPFPRFPEVAEKYGLDNPDQSGGAVIDDFDGDGDLDLITSSINPSEPLHFMANGGDGTFTNRSEDAGFAGILGGLNMVQADYDNDGDVDLLVLRGAWWGKDGHIPNSLLANDGSARFTDVSFEAGIAEPAFPTQAANFADYDLDGDLDLYIGDEWEQANPSPSQLFRNNGDGTFTDVAKAAGVENLRFAKGVAWGDFDNDRDPDLYVSNLGGPNRLYRNEGNGTFKDVAEKLGVTKPIRGFPTWFFDFDNDGNLDIYASSYWNQPQYVVARYFGKETDAELSSLYRGDGHGGFTDVGVAMNLVKNTMAMGANFGDLDNDGFPDFYLGTGYPSYEGIVQNFMYWNRDGKRFSDVSTNGGFAHIQKGHAVAFGDLDNDGDQDVFEQMGGAFKGDGFNDVLFENPGFGNHWLKVRLVGVKSNRFGVGARIRCEVVEDGKTRSIFKWVNSGASFGCNPLRQEIGIGKAPRVAHLEVYWPVSDTKQSFDDVPGDTGIEITEGAKDYRVVPIVKCAPH